MIQITFYLYLNIFDDVIYSWDGKAYCDKQPLLQYSMIIYWRHIVKI